MSVRAGSDDSLSQGGDDTEKRSGSTSNKKGSAGLFEAVANKDVAAAKAAIKMGVDVNKADEHGWTPLRKSARAGDLQLVSLLIDNGASVTEADKIVVVTAASWGRVDALRQILKAKADVGPTSEWEVSPLVSACQHGHLRAVKLLIEYEADVNQIDKSGNDPLIVAWESNRSAIVFYLVEMGANVKTPEDWNKVAASSSTAQKIAQGLMTRQKNKFRENEMKGTLSAEAFKSEVRVPMRSMCRLTEQVPVAMLTLMDRVLLLTPQDVPVRADLQNQTMRTSYLDIDEWEPKEEPRLWKLAPKDTGDGCPINIQVLHQQGILSRDFMFVLTICDSVMFKSITVQTLLLHSWRNLVRARYTLDFLLELGAVASLFLWWIIVTAENIKGFVEPSPSSKVFFYLSFAFVVAVTLEDICEERRQFNEFKKQDRFEKYRFQYHMFAFFRIVCSIAWLETTMEMYLGDGHQEMERTPIGYFSNFVLSFVIIGRWYSLMNYIKGIEMFGPRVIPIMNTFNCVGPFVLVTLTVLIGFTHAMSMFGDALGRNWGGDRMWEEFLLVFELGMLRDEGMGEQIRTAATNPNFLLNYAIGMYQIFYIMMTVLIALALTNVLIAIIDTNFDFEQEEGYTNFLVSRASFCFRYFVQMSGSFTDAPREKILQKCLPSIFSVPEKTGYLWTCYKVDEDAELADMDDAGTSDLSFSAISYGRLGFIRSAVDRSMRKTQYKLRCRINDMQANLQKEMRLTQGYLHRARDEISETCRQQMGRDGDEHAGDEQGPKAKQADHSDIASSNGRDAVEASNNSKASSS